MTLRALRARRAMGLLEVLIVAVLATLIAIPLYNLIQLSGHEAMTSEDYRLAELLAERVVASVMARSWDGLNRFLPTSSPFQGVPGGDAAIARAYPEYARFFASQGFTGQVDVSEVEKGLLAIEVHLTWPVKPGSGTRRSYSMLRFRAQEDAGVRSSWPVSKGKLLRSNEAEDPPSEETP